MTRLAGRTVARGELADADVEAMFTVFRACFAGATRARFERDLAEKDWAIVLHDAAGAVQGFSTLSIYETTVEGRRVGVVYSGDTVIRPDHWGTPELPRTWIRSVLRLSEGLARPLYWLLLSSGYKTYRMLPVFFHVFHPRHDAPTPPDVRRTLDELARRRFGADYRADLGVVRFAAGGTPLRAGVADLSPARLRDPHVDFFARANPGNGAGDELVCLAEIDPDNFTALGRRMAGLDSARTP